MSEKENISRRQFVTRAISAAALSTLPVGRSFAGSTVAQGNPSSEVPLTDSPVWRDQGIENLAKSPHAKLRDIPVRAVI
jgi:hypothetical protein